MFNFELSVKILLSVIIELRERDKKNGFLRKKWKIHSISFPFLPNWEKTEQLFNQALNKVLADLQNQNYEIIDVQLSTGLTTCWEATARYLILYKKSKGIKNGNDNALVWFKCR
ncbi:MULTISPECIES: hypothetical protein [Lactococcus]|uniref:hypothetical protein n=1 Tax=Lactococcus TaxID=1357 RepID=UPI001CDBD51B|nr:MULTISPECIES: hypothetical protein [Lactococcus]MCA2389831.1 hypothetical protein [Lactococcus sp. NH2-7C]WGV30998.1 hypothetical protein QJV49_03115 [Lactococcus sp. NH2-7C]